MMHTLIALLRPRTLPLAIAVICLGNALAYVQGDWQANIFIFSLLTALSLQMLSNVANDYGDGIRGTDNYRDSSSPARLTGSGAVSLSSMRLYIAALVLLSIALGGYLISISVKGQGQILLFTALGALSIAAAIFYTVGRYAYGYAGLGEAAVFLFFGIIGVLGSYALQQEHIRLIQLLPAAAIGLLCAAVLNVNNLRDIDSDKQAGKFTLAVRLGFYRAKQFHALLLIGACLLLLIFSLCTNWKSALWLLLFPALRQHGKRVLQTQTPRLIAVELKSIVGLCLGISLLLSIGILFSNL